MSELLKPIDAAQLAGVSYPTLKQWIYKGKIRTTKTIEITIVATGGHLAQIQQESAPMLSPRKPGCTGRVGHCRAVQSRSRSPA